MDLVFYMMLFIFMEVYREIGDEWDDTDEGKWE
jgi:hypothetical protein